MHLHFAPNMHLRFAITTLLNITLTSIQVFYANRSHSVSLLSDALHNLGDVLGLLIAWGAQAIAFSKKHSPKYTYGYQKSTVIATFCNALLLLLSVGIIIRETVFKITHMEHMNEMQVLVIACFGILVNGLTALLFIKDKDHNLNMRAAFLHLTLDALTSCGVVLSALITYYLGYQWVDSVMAVVIASVIFVSGWTLLRRSLDLLIDAVPPHIDLQQVRCYLTNIPGVTHIQHLHVWAVSDQSAALTVHLTIKDIKSFNYRVVEQELNELFKIKHVTLQAEESI